MSPGTVTHRERVFDLDPLRGKEQRKRQGGRSRRTRWARFRHLDKLALGDELTVYAGEHPYRHAVTIKRIVGPSGVSVLMPTARLVVTLISCYPYMVDTQCIVIVAELQ